MAYGSSNQMVTVGADVAAKLGVASGTRMARTAYDMRMNQYNNQQAGQAAMAQRAAQAAMQERQQEYGSILAEQGQMGQQEEADIREGWAGTASRGYQDAISSGLGGSSIMGGLRAMYGRAENADVGLLQNRLRRERLGMRERELGTYPGAREMMGVSQQQGYGFGY